MAEPGRNFCDEAGLGSGVNGRPAKNGATSNQTFNSFFNWQLVSGSSVITSSEQDVEHIADKDGIPGDAHMGVE